MSFYPCFWAVLLLTSSGCVALDGVVLPCSMLRVESALPKFNRSKPCRGVTRTARGILANRLLYKAFFMEFFL